MSSLYSPSTQELHRIPRYTHDIRHEFPTAEPGQRAGSCTPHSHTLYKIWRPVAASPSRIAVKCVVRLYDGL
jgi:hypothetical protein